MTAAREGGRWTAWLAAWLAIVAVSLLAATALAQLSSESAEASLDDALAQHLRGEAGILAEALRDEPLGAVLALGGPRSADAVRARLVALRDAGGLHDVALFPPTGEAALGRAEAWVAAKADAGLIVDARAGRVGLGPLYRASDGEIYRAAYAPVPGHEGWVLAVEGSGATLGAVDRLEELQALVGAAVVALAAAVGALLAAAVARPLLRLDTELDAASPGDAPETITVQGPIEVRRVAASARRLLGAIRERDRALGAAHDGQVRQLTALSAAVAHEVRNPLHALSFTLESLRRAAEPERRTRLLARARDRVEEIERIVSRFLDLSRPLDPRRVEVDVAGLVGRVATDAGLGEMVHVGGECGVGRTDPELLGQVVGNLLRNAREAGATRIDVRLGAEGLEVADDGPGVSDVDVEHLFTWFHTSRAQGTGLGLPQSRRICEALGGDLTLVRPRPATFRVTLPPEPT